MKYLKKTLLAKQLILPISILFIMISSNGLTQESTEPDSLQNQFCFSETQIRELRKATLELDEANDLIHDLGLLVNNSQYKINSLDKLIHDKNKYIYKQDKKIKRLKVTRNISIGVGITAFAFLILK